jgi:hypothetical protein
MYDVVSSFITRLYSNIRTALTTRKTKENNCVTSHAQNMTALQPNIFLNGITSVAGHKRGTVVVSQRKPLPRSTAYSSVSICYDSIEEP